MAGVTSSEHPGRKRWKEDGLSLELVERRAQAIEVSGQRFGGLFLVG